MNRSGYGGVGAAITSGMRAIYAAERSPTPTVLRNPMAKVAYGAPAPLWPPFETIRQATAGPDDDDRPACAGMDPEIFFMDLTRKENQDQLVTIRKVCMACPRRARCQADGTNEEHGIWGGWTPSERKHLKTKKRRAR